MRNQTASLLVSSSPSSSSSTPQWKYDVFLSFRGEDTRNKFTDHLYTALKRRGFVVFRDDEELERGKTIAPELLKAIEESRCSIVIFSRNYVSSTWCLNELVKIFECMKKKVQLVLPVFYDVDPSEVRKQIGSIREAFAKHEEDFRENIKKVREWRTVMTEVANVSGWDLKNGSEAKLIQKIVQEIWCKLSHSFPSVVDGLVGIDSRLMELNTYLGEGLDDVRFIGICGMGGIGKTTIVRVVHERLSHQFESSCFLVNVKEVSEKLGLVPLQNQLLSEVLKEPNINVLNVYKGVDMIRSRLQYKKVLLILDDVDNLEQLNMLAGNRDWFGSGSRIFITTRNEQVLRAHGVKETYKAKELIDDESLTLFSWKAFKQNHPVREYEELSKRVTNYANGLPLVLEVLGSNLCGQSVTVWESYLEKLDKIPDKDILNKLKVSFDGLDEVEKKIFLDIACFFKGCDKDHVTKILDGCGFYSCSGIQKLIDKSLIKVTENLKMKKQNLWMHDQLEYMGMEIVRQECTEEPEKRSRLWAAKDVNHVLTKNMGTNKIEAILMDLPKRIEEQWNVDSFSKMPKLRLLKIHNVHLYRGPKCLSNELRFLEWHGYPSECLPSIFHPDKLVELNICYSGIKQLWKGKEALENLKFITLSHCQNLTKTPDFTGIPNLEMLILEGCTRLCEVHPSVGLLRKLIFLNLRDCRSLRSLASNIEMESLEIFVLSGCSKLGKFPEITGKMELLSELSLDGTAIVELPSSIEHLTGLVLLNLRDCKNLVCLPSSIYGLKSLKRLILSGCCKLQNLPKNLGEVECLEELDVSGTAVRQPPSTIFLLKELKVLSFRGCKDPPSNSWPLQFWLMRRNRLEPKPMPLMLPSLSGLCSLTKLDLSDCNIGEGAIPNDISCLSSLEELNLSSNNLGEGGIPNDIGCLSLLRKLNLSSNNFVSLPTSINRLSRLYELNVENCKRLQSLPKLSSYKVHVEASACMSLEMLPDPLKHCSIEELQHSPWLAFYCLSCFKLVENQDCSSMATRMLKRYLQGAANLRSKFDIVIPGNKIPGWVGYQTEGNKVTIQSSQLLNNKNKLIGFVACTTFVVHQHSPVVGNNNRLLCIPHADDEEFFPRPFFTLEDKLGQADHLWLVYIPRAKHRFWFSNFEKASHFGFSIRSNFGPSLEVKKFGVHPVFEQDVIELNQTMNQYSTSTFENSNVLPQDFDGSILLDGSMIKRINTGPGGSDSFEDKPHPKRLTY